MLIQFRVKNFRSIREQQTLSMVASPIREHIEANTFDSGVTEVGALLRSCAIYGANAAGKTNLLRALQFMQSQVLHSATAPQTATIPHDPFKFSALTARAPSEFEIAFISNKIRYEYGFSIGADRIESEWLTEYPRGRPRKVFERSFTSKQRGYAWSFSSHFKGNRVLWRDSTRENALFLSTAIQLNSEYLKAAFEWFQKRLVVITGASVMNPVLTLKVLDQPDGKNLLLPFLREADSGISDLAFRREPVPANALIVSPGAIVETSPTGQHTFVRVTFSHLSSDTKTPIPLDFSDESNGTQLLFRSAGAWLNVFANGETLLVDEIDTSLHSILVRFLIERFHSEKTNQNNAQLVFSTHNTTLLSQDLFRRDQIWFVEKDSANSSRVFPLSDFSPRKDEAIERWYLRGRYGALPILSELPS